MIDIQTLLTSGIILAAGGVVGYALKDIPLKAYNWAKRIMLYSVTVYQNDELFDVLEDYLFANYNQHYKDVEAVLVQHEASTPGIKGAPPKRELKYKQEESFFVAKISGKKIFISKSKEKIEKAQSMRDIYYRKYVIKGFLAKEEINQFLLGIVMDYNEKLQKGTLKVYTSNLWGEWMPMHDISVKPFKMVIIPEEQKNMIIDDLKDFVSSAEWYKIRGIRHKRGYLFSGPPGNGKTTLAMAMAEELNRDLYILNLNSIENDSCLIKAFAQLGTNVILLIEDIDRAFVKRDNVDSKVSFSTVLNQFDGALCRDGIITVITTNHLEKLDEALIRDGRIDVRQEIPNPSASLVKEYLELFYNIKIATEIDSWGMSMSSVQEFCIRNKENSLTAINKFSKQKTA